MKSITLQVQGQFKTDELIKSMVSTDLRQGFTFIEMRQRLKILDKLEAANGVLELEDADYNLLKSILEKTTFTVADKDLDLVITGILEPERPAPSSQPNSGAKEKT